MALPTTVETKESDKQDTPKPETAPVPTPEQIEQMAQENMAEWFDNDRQTKSKKSEEKPAEKKEEKKPDDQKPADKAEEKKPAEQKPGEQKAESPEKKAAPKIAGLEEEVPLAEKPTEKKIETKAPARALDDDDIEAVADRVADRLKPKEEKKEKPDPFAGFEGRDRAQLEALRFLGETDARFKGRDLASETVKFWQKEQEYISAWEAKNPGETFDPLDSAHAGFYRANEPQGVTDEDISDAKVEMRVDKRAQEIEQKVERKAHDRMEKRLQPLERKEIIQEKAPLIKQSINAAVAELVAGVAPEAMGESKDLTKEVVDKLEAEDPIAVELISEESKALNIRVREIENMRHLGSHFEFDEKLKVKIGDQVVQPHTEILETAIDLEEKILEQPEANRVFEGKQFVTRDERLKQIQRIQKSDLPAEDKDRRISAFLNRTWCIELDDIRAAFVANSVRRVNKTLALVKKGRVPAETKAAKSAEKPAAPEVPEEKEKTGKKPAPSSAAESDIVHTRVPGVLESESNAEKIRKAWFS